MYLNEKHLYRWEMSGYLPYGVFKWLKIVDTFDANSISEKIAIGYILEVDLEYPDELYELHDDYPLAPEKLSASYVCSKKIAEKYGIKVADVKELIASLGGKTNYVVYYRNLQLYLSLRMKLTKIHRILKFNQSHWMKTYIDFNIEKRKNTDNGFEKDFFLS